LFGTEVFGTEAFEAEVFETEVIRDLNIDQAGRWTPSNVSC
jgi:hypothetical protein